MSAELDNVSDELEECISAVLPERKPSELGYRPRTVDWSGRVTALIALGYCRIEYRYSHVEHNFAYADERRFKDVAARAKASLALDYMGRSVVAEEECQRTKK